MNVFIVNVVQQNNTVNPVIINKAFKTLESAIEYIDCLGNSYIESGNFNESPNNVKGNRIYLNSKLGIGYDIHVFLTTSEL